MSTFKIGSYIFHQIVDNLNYFKILSQQNQAYMSQNIQNHPHEIHNEQKQHLSNGVHQENAQILQKEAQPHQQESKVIVSEQVNHHSIQQTTKIQHHETIKIENAPILEASNQRPREQQKILENKEEPILIQNMQQPSELDQVSKQVRLSEYSNQKLESDGNIEQLKQKNAEKQKRQQVDVNQDHLNQEIIFPSQDQNLPAQEKVEVTYKLDAANTVQFGAAQLQHQNPPAKNHEQTLHKQQQPNQQIQVQQQNTFQQTPIHQIKGQQLTFQQGEISNNYPIQNHDCSQQKIKEEKVDVKQSPQSTEVVKKVQITEAPLNVIEQKQPIIQQVHQGKIDINITQAENIPTQHLKEDVKESTQVKNHIKQENLIVNFSENNIEHLEKSPNLPNQVTPSKTADQFRIKNDVQQKKEQVLTENKIQQKSQIAYPEIKVEQKNVEEQIQNIDKIQHNNLNEVKELKVEQNSIQPLKIIESNQLELKQFNAIVDQHQNIQQPKQQGKIQQHIQFNEAKPQIIEHNVKETLFEQKQQNQQELQNGQALNPLQLTQEENVKDKKAITQNVQGQIQNKVCSKQEEKEDIDLLNHAEEKQQFIFKQNQYAEIVEEEYKNTLIIEKQARKSPELQPQTLQNQQNANKENEKIESVEQIPQQQSQKVSNHILCDHTQAQPHKIQENAPKTVQQSHLISVQQAKEASIHQKQLQNPSLLNKVEGSEQKVEQQKTEIKPTQQPTKQIQPQIFINQQQNHKELADKLLAQPIKEEKLDQNNNLVQFAEEQPIRTQKFQQKCSDLAVIEQKPSQSKLQNEQKINVKLDDKIEEKQTNKEEQNINNADILQPPHSQSQKQLQVKHHDIQKQVLAQSQNIQPSFNIVQQKMQVAQQQISPQNESNQLLQPQRPNQGEHRNAQSSNIEVSYKDQTQKFDQEQPQQHIQSKTIQIEESQKQRYRLNTQKLENAHEEPSKHQKIVQFIEFSHQDKIEPQKQQIVEHKKTLEKPLIIVETKQVEKKSNPLDITFSPSKQKEKNNEKPFKTLDVLSQQISSKKASNLKEIMVKQGIGKISRKNFNQKRVQDVIEDLKKYEQKEPKKQQQKRPSSRRRKVDSSKLEHISLKSNIINVTIGELLSKDQNVEAEKLLDEIDQLKKKLFQLEKRKQMTFVNESQKIEKESLKIEKTQKIEREQKEKEKETIQTNKSNKKLYTGKIYRRAQSNNSRLTEQVQTLGYSTQKNSNFMNSATISSAPRQRFSSTQDFTAPKTGSKQPQFENKTGPILFRVKKNNKTMHGAFDFNLNDKEIGFIKSKEFEAEDKCFQAKRQDYQRLEFTEEEKFCTIQRPTPRDLIFEEDFKDEIEKFFISLGDQLPRRDWTQQELIETAKETFKRFGVNIQAEKNLTLSVKKYKNCVSFVLDSNRTILWYYQGKFYYGGWKTNKSGEGQKNGWGYDYSPGKYVYSGTFFQNKRDGYGIIKLLTRQNDIIYEGGWKNGFKHGLGKQRQADESQYIGEWVQGKKNGKGKIKGFDQEYFEGGFINGVKNGEGTQRFKNGDTYEGNYYDGKFHGMGVYVWANFSKYQGQFKEGSRNGNGIWISNYNDENSDRYEGQYKNDRKSGFGVYRWKDGTVYQGQFLNDLKHGEGIVSYGDGKSTKLQWFEGNVVPRQGLDKPKIGGVKRSISKSSSKKTEQKNSQTKAPLIKFNINSESKSRPTRISLGIEQI